jgi:hypothetical protein
MILDRISALIYEVEEFSTLERIFRYGPIKSLALYIWRSLNYEVLDFYSDLLKKTDDCVIYFDSTEYKASKYINRIDIGEIANKSKIEEGDDKLSVLKNFFNIMNQIISNLFKCYIDELADNKIKFENVSTVSSLLSIKNNLKSREILFDLIEEYNRCLTQKPTSALNIISSLKRKYLDSKFIHFVFDDLDKKVTQFIAKKQELSSTASIIRKTEL